MTLNPAIVPELDVTDLAQATAFYVDVCGFAVLYSRPEERFVYLKRGDAELMLEEADGPGRRFRHAVLEHPFGRGLNLQIRVDNVDALYESVQNAGAPVHVELEERWYQVDDQHLGNRQFVVSDPDGYLLRFFADLGTRDDGPAGVSNSQRIHAWRIDPAQYRRQEQQRGRRYAFEGIDALRTALVVIDMIPFFLEDNLYCMGIVPNINRLATSLRRAGGKVAWVLPEFRATAAAREFFGGDRAEQLELANGTGPLPERLWHGLDAEASDLYSVKTSASALFPGQGNLRDQLNTAAVDTVVIVGTVTNVCCEATARDASALGYRVIVAADGTATVNNDMHNASLLSIYRSFGDVRPTQDIVAMIDASISERLNSVPPLRDA